MLIRLGYELAYEFPQATPMILNLNVHYSRASDWVRADTILTEPAVPLATYRDSFGNWCTRATAPAGQFRVTSDALIKDSGIADPSFPHAFEHTVDSLRMTLWCSCFPAVIARPNCCRPRPGACSAA